MKRLIITSCLLGLAISASLLIDARGGRGGGAMRGSGHGVSRSRGGGHNVGHIGHGNVSHHGGVQRHGNYGHGGRYYGGGFYPYGGVGLGFGLGVPIGVGLGAAAYGPGYTEVIEEEEPVIIEDNDNVADEDVTVIR